MIRVASSHQGNQHGKREDSDYRPSKALGLEKGLSGKKNDKYGK